MRTASQKRSRKRSRKNFIKITYKDGSFVKVKPKSLFYKGDKQTQYKKYLRSSKWKNKRKKVLNRDRCCAECKSMLNLQVHHTTYDRIFKEDLDDLITLCKKCHYKMHN